MSSSIHFRYGAAEEFFKARKRASWRKFFAIFSRKQNSLINFDASQALPAFKEYLGVQEIPLQHIVGSVGRSQDFDADFYPLKYHLLSRWVDVYILALTRGLPLIKVYQLNDNYYLIDGHHRVSVTRHLGNKYIEAEVWRYRLTTNAGTNPMANPLTDPVHCCVNSTPCC